MRFSLLCMVSLGLFGTSGCGQVENAPAAGPAASRPAGAKADGGATPGELVSVEEGEEFARKLEEAFENHDVATFNSLIDYTTIAERAIEGLGLPEGKGRSLAANLAKGARGEQNLLSVMLKTAGDEGTYRLLRLYEKEGKRHALLRFTGEEGLNYHDFTLSNASGVTRASGAYFYLSGEELSATWRRAILPMVQEENKNLIQKLATRESEYIKHQDKVLRMIQQMAQGDSEGVLATYASLPEAVRKDKNVLLIRYQAALKVDDAAITEATEDFLAAYPNDPCLDFIGIDLYILREDHAKARECVDRLDKGVGIDPYLDVVRGNIAVSEKNYAEAERYMHQAIANLPDMISCYWNLAGVALLGGNHQLLYDTLHSLNDNFEVEFEDIRTVPNYADFVASPQGQKWLAEQGFTE